MTQNFADFIWWDEQISFELIAVVSTKIRFDPQSDALFPQPDSAVWQQSDFMNAVIGGRTYQFLKVGYKNGPSDIRSAVGAWLKVALDAGADFAWAMFDESMRFDNVLGRSIAPEIFGIITPTSLDLALDDEYRNGQSWSQRVVDIAGGLELPPEPQEYSTVIRNPYCRVCGYECVGYFPWGWDDRTPSFNFCPCCRVEWGYQDNNARAADAFRTIWIESGAKWDERRVENDGLTTEERLHNIGL
jgi:hypothetical protein